MTCGQALISLFLLAPCEDGGGGEAIEMALADAARPAADVTRDESRKPGEILALFGIAPGMTVLEVFAGGGYYTQILDGVVGENGRLLAHNNQAYLNFVGPQFQTRFEDGGLSNTEQLVAEANELEFEAGSLDAVLMVLTYHDFLFGEDEYGWPDVDEAAFLDTLCAAMKPGAVLGLIDHVAEPGGDAAQIAQGIHRIDPNTVKADFAASCFDLAETSDLLANPEDDLSSSATQGPMQGNTDRFIFKFIRK
jgi:predicted methyltransferase